MSPRGQNEFLFEFLLELKWLSGAGLEGTPTNSYQRAIGPWVFWPILPAQRRKPFGRPSGIAATRARAQSTPRSGAIWGSRDEILAHPDWDAAGRCRLVSARARGAIVDAALAGAASDDGCAPARGFPGVTCVRVQRLTAGLSHVSKELVEEFFAPCGELHLAGKGSVSG